MNLNTVSIFDLSPPEKLQLVEDIWDDLAAIGVGMIKWRNVLGAFYCRVGLESIKDHPFVADVMDVEPAYDKKSASTIVFGGGCILVK